MRKRSRIQNLSLCLGGFAVVGFAGHAFGQAIVTGNLATTPVNYGSNVPGTGALATQTINTSFGDSTYAGTPPDANGSELDAAYGVVKNGNLNLFFAGNYEGNGNHLAIFIDDGATGGQNVLNISNGWTAAGMNGSTFSPGFNANVLIDPNDYSQNLYVDEYQLNATGSTNSYLGNVSLSSGIGKGTLGGIAFGLNNSNTAGVTGDQNGGAASTSAAQAVSTGLELSIPMTALGNPTSIKVLAVVNGGNDGFMSNQALPGLPAGTISIGNIATSTPPGPGPYSVAGSQGAFNFSSLANEYFTVPVGAVANGTWLNPTSNFSWGTAANWSNGYIPHVAGDVANFGGATITSTVTLDGARSVGTLTFTSDGNPYTLAAGSGGVLTMDNGSSGAGITNFTGSNTISAPVVLNSATTITVVTNPDTLTVSGNISGAGSLTAYCPGNGVVLLTGVNTYGGGTTVEEGNLRLGSNTALPTGTALSIGGYDVPSGTIDLNGFNATVSSLTAITAVNNHNAVAQIINTSTAAVTSTLTYAGIAATPSTYVGNIGDNSGSNGATTALTVSSGSLTLTGTDTYAGTTTVNNGATLTFASTGGTAYPAGGNTVNNGQLVLNDTVTAGNITGSGTTTVTSAMNVSITNITQGAVDNEGNLTLVTGGTAGPITGAGALALDSGTLQLAHNSGGSTQAILYIAPGATLDINNNHFLLAYGVGGDGDPIASIASLIQSGYAGGAWTGTGIDSSAAAANSANYGIGYADSADPGNPAGLASGTIEIKYTLLGDANLDGSVNSIDFAILASNFNKAVSGWDQGDFNYDGTVNSIDFADLAGNFNKGASQADVSALEAFASANGLLADVPEPSMAALGMIAGAGMLLRRRRAAKMRLVHA